MRADAYLERIRYEGPRAPTAETLRGLHRAHMMAVPFENLDIHLGIPIALSVPAFYDKLVTRRRGGFCYELNGLFAWLLAELGFRVELLSARVFTSGRLSPDFDHLLILVEREDRWIADVGFGDSSLEPLRVASTRDVEEAAYSVAEERGAWTVRRRRGGVREPQYVFSLSPRHLDDFEARCLFQQTSPESHFTRTTICSLATQTGRLTLSGRRLIVTSADRRGEHEIASAEEYRSILEREFGIELDTPDVDRLMAASRVER